MRKPFAVAAWSMLILLIVGTLAGMFLGGVTGFVPVTGFSGGLLVAGVIYNLAALVLGCLALYGFLLLGRKLKSDWIVVLSWIGYVLIAVYTLYVLFGGLVFDIPGIPTQEMFLNVDNEGMQFESGDVYNFLILLAVTHLIYSIIFGVYSVLFGVALVKVGSKIKYARATGILNIIAGATMIIFIGYLVYVAAAILEVMLLFEASRKFDKK